MAQPKRSEPVVATRRVPLASPAARWLIAAAVLGSGVAFLDSTMVNVALPAIGRELGAGLTGQQWVLDGYLLSLTSRRDPALGARPSDSADSHTEST